MSSFDELYDVVMEANAYNKLANELKDEGRAEVRKWDAYDTLRCDTRLNDRERKIAKKKADEHIKNANIIAKKFQKKMGSPYNMYSPNGHSDHSGDLRERAKESKKQWMDKHGNEGYSPEERYKENRYLRAQKTIKGVKESVDDLRLEIYESCRYGDISEEERDLLLEMI